MIYRALGDTGLNVSILSFGASSLGGVFHDFDEKKGLEAVELAIELAKTMQENNESTVLAPDYVDGNVSVKVVKIIQSYTKIVNKVMWSKKQ